MTDKIKKAIKKYDMLKKGDKLIVGLSGGADSVALLYVLLSLREEYDLKISVCHINHCLRGEKSDADEAFVRNLCNKLNVDLTCFSVDVEKISSERKIGLEQCGRQVRYEKFASLSEKVATAHTATDNIETVLLNLSRGAALNGMRGILPVNKMGNLTVIRPLIFCSREEIEAYLSEMNQDYVTDMSNFDTVYTRNLIRHKIVPVLRDINPSIEDAVTRMTVSVSEDAQMLDEMAQKAFDKAKDSEYSFDTEYLKTLNSPVLTRVCSKMLRLVGLEPSSEKIEYISAALYGKKQSIGGGWYVLKRKNQLVFEENFEKQDFELPLLIGTTELPFNKNITLEVIDGKNFDKSIENSKKFLYYTLDYDKMNRCSVIRNRRDGDKVKLHGRSFTNSLKKLFYEQVELSERHKRIILSDIEGIIFVEGFGCAERVRVTENTEKILTVQIKSE